MGGRPGEGDAPGWAAPGDPWATPSEPYATPPSEPPSTPDPYRQRPYQAPVIFPPATAHPPAATGWPSAAAPAPPPAAAPPPPAPPPAPPPYVPPPYAAPAVRYTGGPLPSWAYPGTVPPRLGRGSRPDPWQRRGWLTRGGIAVRALTIAALLMLPLVAATAGAVAEERAYARHQKEVYAPVRGVVTEHGSSPYEYDLRFTGRSEQHGEIVIPVDPVDSYEGEPMTVLVARDDATAYLLPADQADPVVPLVFLVLFALAATACAVAAVLLHRARRGSVEAVTRVASRAPETSPPYRLHTPPPTNVPALAGGLALAALLGLGAASSARAALRPPVEDPQPVVVVDGEVFNGSDDQGRPALEVRYYDERQNGLNHRPLTPDELARVPRPGDTVEVSFRYGEPYFDDGDRAGFGAFAVLLGVPALAVAWRTLVWNARLRRAARGPARPVEAVGWVRVVRGRNWLVLWPAGATHVRQAVAVPLVGEREMPPALTGTLYVHGRLKGGHPVLVREPGGGVLWPSGPARGGLFAEVTFVPVAPPGAPLSIAAPAYPPPAAWPQATGA